MYPDFMQEMAMGIGDEFDCNKVKGFQLATFADDCNLSPSFVIRRHKHLKKTLNAAYIQVAKLLKSDEEIEFFKQYQKTIPLNDVSVLLNKTAKKSIYNLR